jgi:hypothetical protein
VSDKLPPVRADRAWLPRAILNLLEPSVGYHYNVVFESSIFAQETDDNMILLKIAKGLELSMDQKYDSLEAISFPGNGLSVASMILNQLGSRLEFRRLPSLQNEYQNEGTEFEFELPIWH